MACRAAFMVTTRRDRHTSLLCTAALFFFDSNQPAAPAGPYFFHATPHIPNQLTGHSWFGTLVILPPERDHHPYFSIIAFSLKKSSRSSEETNFISRLDHGVDRYCKR